MYIKLRFAIIFLGLLIIHGNVPAQQKTNANITSGTQLYTGAVEDFITDNKLSEYDFPLITPDNTALNIVYDKDDYPGVIRAIGDLQNDIDSVTGTRPNLANKIIAGQYDIVIGTLGKSKAINNLVRTNKLNISDLHDKWESFIITTVRKKDSGNKPALVIIGSDKRGTIYGIYELSHQLGVSPWYWWADVPVKKRTSAWVLNGRYTSGQPKVKYRGIFINDEIPCMTGWAKEKFGGMNSKMYAHVFELLLRLRANYLWPGMWGAIKEYNPTVPILLDENGNYEGNCFNEDDPDNPRLADEYGIIMGTSHHEPMQRSQQEWLRHKQNYGNGEWNYLTNKQGIQKFFREGIENTKNYERIITMGMRGDDDKPMVDAGSAEANFRVLEQVMKDQRNIIEEVTGQPASKTPQIWTLYSEVLEYYDQGMKVPDDMIIVLCDDNWGNVRRLPELTGNKHPGGYGMYYHVCYYGAPRANKWISNVQLMHMWEQLQLTYSYGVNKLWILNVGDLKPNEYAIDFFLNMAWDPTRYTVNNLNNYSELHCAEMFGEDQADEAAEILNTQCKYNSWVTPEMLDDKTFNLENGEFLKVKDAYLALEAKALRQFLQLNNKYKDTYNELVLFPIQAMANLYDMYYALAMNKKMATENNPEANYWADRVEYCFIRDSVLGYNYNHEIANGKWNHMMDQVHIGYTSWHPPKYNTKPEVIRIKPESVKSGGYIFSEQNNVVVMEAGHYFKCQAANHTTWTVLPDLGRTLSGIGVMPYTESTRGSSITYKMYLETKPDSLNVKFILKTTMPFIKGGHKLSASIDGGSLKTWNINSDLIWKNCYTKMYPTGAAKIIEIDDTLPLPENSDGDIELTIYPNDPGIVLHKVIINNGGYQDSRLFMPESPYVRP